jgi:ATP-binding cassette subfamily F protein 3
MTEKLKNQQREYEAQQQYRQHAQEFIDKFRYNAKRASLVFMFYMFIISLNSV